MIRHFAILSLMVSVSCGQAKTHFHHSPLARTDWERITPARATIGEEKPKGNSKREERVDIREQMVLAAEKLLDSGDDSSGYGAEDLESILSQLGLEVSWRASDTLEALVRIAKKKGAFRTDNGPDDGDIVLFHNQVDANGNGLVDDWLTGCGIVIEQDSPKFVAMARTGHAPRRVVVWPDGPARNTVSGETVNSYLRVPHRSDGEDTMYLAGQLYAGYIDIERLATSQ